MATRYVHACKQRLVESSYTAPSCLVELDS